MASSLGTMVLEGHVSSITLLGFRIGLRTLLRYNDVDEIPNRLPWDCSGASQVLKCILTQSV